MQLHEILLLRTSAILPEAISAGGLTPTTDTSLFLTTYRGGSHLPADILYMTLYQSSDNLSTHFLLWRKIYGFRCHYKITIRILYNNIIRLQMQQSKGLERSFKELWHIF